MQQELNPLKKRILIIEDSQATIILITEFLKKLGYDFIYSAKTGKDGIEMFENLLNDGIVPVILLDQTQMQVW
jgi:CheY-like chemotaxis protein